MDLTHDCECTISRHPYAFVDKKSTPILIKCLSVEQHSAFAHMYLEHIPRNSFNGLPPMRDDHCSAWIDSMVSGGPNLIAVSFDEGVVGHVGLFPMDGGRCEMIVVVHPSFQNRGIGTQLVRCAMQLANEAGFDNIWLSVEAQNYIARHVYARCGFAYLTANACDEVDMTFDLSGFRKAADRPVSRIMKRDVISVPTDASCAVVIDLFLKHRIAALPVTDGGGGVAGILSETDLITELNPQQRVGTVMTRGVVTMGQDCTVGKAIRLFQSHRFRLIPVVDHAEKLVGVVGRKDILQLHYRNMNQASGRSAHPRSDREGSEAVPQEQAAYI